MMQVDKAERREDRLLSRDAATMILADGRQIRGQLGNMNLGGMLFVAEDLSAPLQRDTPVEVSISLYGRDSRFTCFVAHQRDNQIGLRLQRDEGS
ncbi:MAG: PilZ domain-containing protein [Magnetococcales bacterium]|nr:PilZ domain-containing protein [Magnetococcales bacterium]MBF0114426.1 PilZ domain-containing protein [Magnetococcales bacterium]